jgi:hypothetical protein
MMNILAVAIFEPVKGVQIALSQHTTPYSAIKGAKEYIRNLTLLKTPFAIVIEFDDMTHAIWNNMEHSNLLKDTP